MKTKGFVFYTFTIPAVLMLMLSPALTIIFFVVAIPDFNMNDLFSELVQQFINAR